MLPSQICCDIERSDIARLSRFSPVLGVVKNLSEKITWLYILNATYVLAEGGPSRLVEEPNNNNNNNKHPWPL